MARMNGLIAVIVTGIVCGLMAMVVMAGGCASLKPYPAVLDSPAMQEAIVAKVRDADINANGQVLVSEPGFRVIVGYVCEGRMIGVNSAGQFTANEEKVHIVQTTQPAKSESEKGAVP